jgi:hypothetical protein
MKILSLSVSCQPFVRLREQVYVFTGIQANRKNSWQKDKWLVKIVID